MATRAEFLDHLWREIIDIFGRDASLDNIIANGRRDPASPSGATGAAIERMLAAGASRRDLSLVLRTTAYEAVFGTLYALGDPGLDEGEEANGLHEELLSADPSGREGRLRS
jgi:hypothetical protein